MKKIISIGSFRINSLLKDITILTSGILFAQLIPILLQPILKRQFSPEEFGVFDMYFRLVSLFSVLITLRYERAIVLAKSKNDALSITVLIVIISTIFLFLTELFLSLFFNNLTILLELQKNQGYILYLFPISGYIYALTISFHFLFIYNKKLRSVSSNKVVRRSAEGGAQVSFGYIGKGFGLVLGDLIGNLGSLIHALFYSRVFLKYLKNYNKIEFRRGLENLKTFSDFPKYSLLSNLLNTFVLSALTFQILSKFGIRDVGFMELTQKILIIPAAIIGVSLGQVLLQRTADAYNSSNSLNSLLKIYVISTIVIIIPYLLIIYFFGEDIFKVFFGSQWIMSAQYSKHLLLSTGIMFIVSPMGQILIGIKRIKINSIWEYLKFFMVVSLFIIPFSNINNYLKLYNLVICVTYLIYIVIIILSVKNYHLSIKKGN